MAERERCISARRVDRRRQPLATSVAGGQREGYPHWTIRPLFVAGHGGADLHELPVGCPVARGWIPRSFSRFRSAHRPAVPLVAVPTDVSVGRGQVVQQRSHLAPSYGAAGPLPDPAVADAAGLVFLPTAKLVSTDLCGIRILRGTGDSVPSARTASDPIICGPCDHVAAAIDIHHRQLRVLQPANDCALLVRSG